MELLLKIVSLRSKELGMKENREIIDGFRAVEFMRRERDLISREIQDMDFAELRKYFEERRTRLARMSPVQSSKVIL